MGQDGRAFFVTDWEASSLRAKLVPGGDYLQWHGGTTMATEISPTTGRMMQQGVFGPGTGYGFSSQGFLPHLDQSFTNAMRKDNFYWLSTGPGQQYTRDQIMLNYATSAGGEEPRQYAGQNMNDFRVVQIPATGGEAGEGAYLKVVPASQSTAVHVRGAPTASGYSHPLTSPTGSFIPIVPSKGGTLLQRQAWAQENAP